MYCLGAVTPKGLSDDASPSTPEAALSPLLNAISPAAHITCHPTVGAGTMNNRCERSNGRDHRAMLWGGLAAHGAIPPPLVGIGARNTFPVDRRGGGQHDGSIMRGTFTATNQRYEPIAIKFGPEQKSLTGCKG